MPRMHTGILPSFTLLACLAAGVPGAAAQSRTAEVASQGGDLRQTSRLLEDLAARVGPAVVEIITLGYANSDLADDERGRAGRAVPWERFRRHRRRRRLHRHQRARDRGRATDPGGDCFTSAARRHRASLGAAATIPARAREGDRRGRRDRSRRHQGGGEGAADARLRRLGGGPSGSARAGLRQPDGAEQLGEPRRHQRRRAAARVRRPDDLHPDRRAHQSGQQRRTARRHGRTRRRHQHPDPVAVGRQRGARLRRTEQHRSQRRRSRSGSTAAFAAERSACARRRSRRCWRTG